jgi:hypothetical protein
VQPVESVEGHIDHLDSMKTIFVSWKHTREQVHTEVKYTQLRELTELHGHLATKRIPGEVYRHQAVEGVLTA